MRTTTIYAKRKRQSNNKLRGKSEEILFSLLRFFFFFFFCFLFPCRYIPTSCACFTMTAINELSESLLDFLARLKDEKRTNGTIASIYAYGNYGQQVPYYRPINDHFFFPLLGAYLITYRYTHNSIIAYQDMPF